MPKSSTVFICQNCGSSFPKWSGQCSNCGEWNTLVETMSEKSTATNAKKQKGVTKQFDPTSVVSYSQVGSVDQPKIRISTTMAEFDRVLGQDKEGLGMVPGAVMLIGGEPGIGKSTLLTQLVVQLLSSPAQLKNPKPILYLAGEE